MPTTRSVVYGSQITHIGSGASMAAGVMSASTDISTALDSTNLLRYDRADLAFMISCTAAVSASAATILVYRRDINFDSTNDEPLPATATAGLWREHLAGIVRVPANSVSQITYYNLTDVPITDQCQFYIENTLNTAIGLGWTLKVTPKSDSFA